MSFTDYLVGLVFFALTVGGAGAAALVICRRRLADLRGATLGLAFALLTTAALLVAHLLPGALGVLDRASVLAVSVALAAGLALRLPRGPRMTEAEKSSASPRSGRVSWALALAGAGAAAIYTTAFAVDQATVATYSLDAAGFHLPNVVAWIQANSLWPVEQFVPAGTQGYYPQNANVLLLAAMLPWENDFLARFVNLPYVAMTAVATYALALELRAPAAAAALFAAIVIAIPAVFIPALHWTVVDIEMLATFGAGVVFLFRHARTQRTSDLALAGLGLGIAAGTKWYGIPAAAIAIAVFAVPAWLHARLRVASMVRRAVALVAIAVAAGGFWMVRNIVEVGNPVFPAEVAPFGVTIFDAPPDRFREQFGFTLFRYTGEPDVLREYVWPAFRRWFGLSGAVLVLTTLLAAALLLFRRFRAPGPRFAQAPVWGAAVGTILLAMAYAATPYSAFGPEGTPYLTGVDTRYAGPALLVGAALGAWVVGRLGRWGVALEALALLAVLDGIRRIDRDTPEVGIEVVTVVIVAGGLILLAALAYALRRSWQRPASSSGRRIRLTLAAALGAIALVAGGSALQSRFNDQRYRGTDATYDWILDRAPSGARIGLAGNYSNERPPAQPGFGDRFDNKVVFVGENVQGHFVPYTTPEPFGEALRRERLDLVLIGRGGRPAPRVPEEEWARSVGFHTVARSPRFTLMRSPSDG